MNIVLLESLGISPERLSEYARPLVEAGHTFNAYPRDLDIYGAQNEMYHSGMKWKHA